MRLRVSNLLQSFPTARTLSSYHRITRLDYATCLYSGKQNNILIKGRGSALPLLFLPPSFPSPLPSFYSCPHPLLLISFQFHLIPSYPISYSSYSILFYPILSHPIPFYPIPSHPFHFPSYPLLSNLFHPNPSLTIPILFQIL